MARVEFPPPADLTQDSLGNVLSGRSVTAVLAGTATAVTHYSALTGGTSTTGGLFTHTDGTTVDGTGARRYVDSGTTMDITISGRTRQVEATSAEVARHIIRKFPIEADYGIVLGAVRGTDATASLIAASAAATAAGGGIVTAAATGNTSRYSFTGQIDFLDRVGFQGAGPRATLMQGTTSGSFLNFEGTGPPSGNFEITGGGVATKNIRVGSGDQRTFLPIRSESASIALLLDICQNTVFMNFHGLACDRGIVFDNGATGNTFVGHTEIGGFRQWAVVFQHTGAFAAPFDYPSYNTINTGMLEHVSAGSVTGVAATDIFTKTAHGFVNGEKVAFRGLTGGAGLSSGTPYFVISATTNTFQVSTTLAGAALNFTTDVTVGTVAYAINGILLDEAGGRGNKFKDTLLSASSATSACTLVESHDPGGYDDKRLQFDDCQFVGDLARLYVTAFDLQDSTNVELTGRCSMHDLLRRFYMQDTCRARIELEPLIVNSAGTYFTSNGGTKVASEVIRWDTDLWDDHVGIVTPSAKDYPYGVTTLLLVAARGYFNRVKVNRATSNAVVAFTTTVAATNNDNVEVAIFDSTGARLATSGNVAGKLNATAGVQTVTLSTALEPGVYFVGLLCPAVGGTAATVVGASAGSANALKTFGATAPKMLGCQQDTLAAGMPTTIVPAFASATLAVLALREA